MQTRRDFLGCAGAAATGRFEGGARRPVVVNILLRGGADGLSLVTPHGDPDYYRLRPTLAVPRPARGNRGSAIDLDGFFGLHPALAPLHPLFDERRLAIVHATGPRAAIRRHFEAERALAALAGIAPSPAPLADRLHRIAREIRDGAGVEAYAVAMDGWDLHTLGERMAPLAAEYAQAVAAFDRELGSRMQGVLLLTRSEFGRSVEENAARGTDHGYGNCMLALGAGVRGGKVYGQWPGLKGRELRVTSDWKEVVAALS